MLALRLESVDLHGLPSFGDAHALCRVTTSFPSVVRFGDITCDGSVTAVLAEIRRCDGVMDRIACFRNSQLASNFRRFWSAPLRRRRGPW
jgi:hypothetical protein